MKFVLCRPFSLSLSLVLSFPSSSLCVYYVPCVYMCALKEREMSLNYSCWIVCHHTSIIHMWTKCWRLQQYSTLQRKSTVCSGWFLSVLDAVMNYFSTVLYALDSWSVAKNTGRISIGQFCFSLPHSFSLALWIPKKNTDSTQNSIALCLWSNFRCHLIGSTFFLCCLFVW